METFDFESLSADTMHPNPLIEALVACANAPNATSTQRLGALAQCHIPYIRASHPKFRMSDPIHRSILDPLQ